MLIPWQDLPENAGKFNEMLVNVWATAAQEHERNNWPNRKSLTIHKTPYSAGEAVLVWSSHRNGQYHAAHPVSFGRITCKPGSADEIITT